MTHTEQQFTMDVYSKAYDAIAYGPHWNGWLTPIVSREVFEDLVSTEYSEPGDDLYFTLSFDDSGVATFTEGGPDSDSYTHVIVPDENRGYDLGVLGWCFYIGDEDEG